MHPTTIPAYRPTIPFDVPEIRRAIPYTDAGLNVERVWYDSLERSYWYLASGDYATGYNPL